MTSNPALTAFRHALRATRTAFHGDAEVLNAARNKIKNGFMENKNLTDTEKAAEEIQKLNEVSKFLTRNIVQGEKQRDGKYFLKFHNDTELGDNESIRQGKPELGSLAGARVRKCSDLKK